MKENTELDSEAMLDLMRYAFLRLDGAWFMASAEKVGVPVATELDIRAWELFSERLGKRIATLIDLKGDITQAVPKLMRVQNTLLNMNTAITVISENKIIHRVLECEIWKMVQKVWNDEEVPCHKVTLASIKGLLKGAFPDKIFNLEHVKKIPLGDPCCEVEITINNPE